MNILIPLAKQSTKIKSVKHKSLIKIEKNITLLDFQITKICESIQNESIVIYLLLNEYQDDIISLCTEVILKNMPINASIKFIKNCNSSLSDSIKTGFKRVRSSGCILIMGDVIFNKESIVALSKKQQSSFLKDTKNLFAKNEIGLWHKDGQIKHFSYSLPEKWLQMCYLNSEFIKNYIALCSDKLLVHEIFNKVLDITNANLVSCEHVKAIEIDRPKDIVIARQVFL